MSTRPVGIVPAGLPIITEPTSTPSDTSLLYTLPVDKAFSHIVVFLMPAINLPPETAMAIYLATEQDVKTAGMSKFKFLGGIGPGKESAVFKVSSSASSPSAPGGGLIVGVSVEPAASVSTRMLELAASKTGTSSTTALNITSAANAPSTVALAQSIIKNAFNFLASFSGTAGPGQVEVVPLKAFEEWWRKFEGRIRSDPSFLERQQD
jgi:hypothetical protein